MSVETTEKEVSIKLDVPFTTNGKTLVGKVKVPMSVAEDLERRQHEYYEDQKRLLRNGGKTIDALDGGTLQG